MRYWLSYFFVTASVLVALWGCDGGDIYNSTEEDLIAVEKIGKMSEDDFLAVMDKCRADPKCRVEMEKYPSMQSSSSKPHSSSSKQEPKSSSLKEPEQQSSSSSYVGSSSDIVYSSEKEPDSLYVESSSSILFDESSSSEEILSSSEQQSSSSLESIEESSSSELELFSSSSEEVVLSSSSLVESSSTLLPPSGTCVVKFTDDNAIEAKKGEPIVLNYIPDEGTIQDKPRWLISDNPKIIEGNMRSLSVTIEYDEKGSHTYAINIDNFRVCAGDLKVNDEQYVEQIEPATDEEGSITE